MASITTEYGTVQYPETVSDKKVIASVWEKNGNCRIYFKVRFLGSTPVDCGFIDVVTGEKAISSRPVSWGQQLSPQVSKI